MRKANPIIIYLPMNILSLRDLMRVQIYKHNIVKPQNTSFSMFCTLLVNRQIDSGVLLLAQYSSIYSLV